MTILLLIGICCLPCIITELRATLRASAEERKEKLGVINGLIKRNYNEEDFRKHTECVICMCEFGPDDEVSPLPCNIGHYFHSVCIQSWIKENPTCPMCREKITP